MKHLKYLQSWKTVKKKNEFILSENSAYKCMVGVIYLHTKYRILKQFWQWIDNILIRLHTINNNRRYTFNQK